jgi:hypothetical protein
VHENGIRLDHGLAAGHEDWNLSIAADLPKIGRPVVASDGEIDGPVLVLEPENRESQFHFIGVT